jgi:2'-5' RNA ligase
VAGGERIRLFCGFPLPRDASGRLVAWEQRHLAGGGRIVPAENLHVTLAFLGSRPASDVPAVASALAAAVAGVGDVRFRVRGYRETRSVGMLALDDEGDCGRIVAERLQASLEELGLYRREARPWLPHVTVLRFRDRPRLDPPLPDLGELRPSDAAAYLSRLRPDGAQYEVLERIELGG